MDQLSNRHFLVDTGASYSIVPHQSSSPPSGPCLRGTAGQLIPCWGEKTITLSLHGRLSTWSFLLPVVSFPIIGVDFLRHFQRMVDPAANMLVDKAGLQSFVNGVVGHSFIFPIADMGGGSSCSPHSLRSSLNGFLVTSPQSPVINHRSPVTGP